eukprot:snap_masked-scaffold198_size266703-processed-gene-0.15 protein:Tk12345 transcript:snap_masked-scaffold198_size266703-processed-gene-0.15-mRNA-1 annotation:"mfs-type transporter c19orf28"
MATRLEIGSSSPGLGIQKARPVFVTIIHGYPGPMEPAVPVPSGTRVLNVHRLRRSQKLGYALGHVLNDLCSSMWFTYLLLYFHKVINFNNFYAGIVLFTGQIADGLATPFVGYFSDQGDDLVLCRRYGKRKAWHVVGSVCVLASFPFIFLRCIGCERADDYAQLIYYAAFVVIFQFGWAATQISHLSLIPDLTDDAHERTGLTAYRYGATVLSSISVYLITWLFLGMAGGSMIGPENDVQFRNIMLCTVSLGAVATVLFHVLVKVDSHEENRLNGSVRPDGTFARPMAVLDWFREPTFYLVGLVYMATRLFVNLTQAYIPLYLQITLQLEASYVAIIPLVMYVVGLCTSISMKWVNRVMGRRLTFILGGLIGFAGCGWIKLGCHMDTSFTDYEIYGVAALIGMGGSTMLITSLSSTADLIGCDNETGAFVYGAMSLLDKFSNGVAVILIQQFIPNNVDTCILCREYFRDILFYVCGFAALLGSLAMASLYPFTLGERARDSRALAYESLPGGSYPGDEAEESANEPRPPNEHAPLLT